MLSMQSALARNAFDERYHIFHSAVTEVKDVGIQELCLFGGLLTRDRKVCFRVEELNMLTRRFQAYAPDVCEPLSKLLVSPLMTPTIVPYMIPYITPFEEFRL